LKVPKTRVIFFQKIMIYVIKPMFLRIEAILLVNLSKQNNETVSKGKLRIAYKQRSLYRKIKCSEFVCVFFYVEHDNMITWPYLICFLYFFR
jgi:hypothetical protein